MPRKPKRTPSKPIARAEPIHLPESWVLVLVAAATLLAYFPAWRGGLLWDDAQHLTIPALQSFRGLWRIWFDVGATQQYYPITHSAFWLQAKLWGANTLGYHLVNILLHVTSAFLVFRILRTLAVPGAVLAAAIFALHPVHVESVAWMTELKNTLSGVFCLAAALWYLRYDEQRAPRAYWTAFGLFALALLSKTAIAPMPAVLLVVAWWKRGRIDLRTDVAPLAPFFALAVAGGVLTAWIERTMYGARGAEFQFSIVERFLIAGRAVWFYLAALIWPQHLSFNYARWSVSQSVWWQYLFPLSAAALGVVCWALRGRTRAPFAAYLIFGGLLVPVLGFLNVYPFRYSFVADHFVYLASIPVIALIACGLVAAARKLELTPTVGTAGAVVLTVGLGVMTLFQARPYASAEALYRHVLARNPDSWLAHNNLAVALYSTNLDEALFHSNEAVRLNPTDPTVHNDRGSILQRTGRTDMAIAEFREAIRLMPTGFATPYNNLCNSLGIIDRYQDAIAACREALKQAPELADAHYNLGIAMLGVGDLSAADEFTAALAAKPNLAEAHYYLGGLLRLRGSRDEARRHYEAAIRLKPDLVDAQYDFGVLLQEMGLHPEAIRQFETALRLAPEAAQAHNSLGVSLLKTGRTAEAIAQFEQAVRLMPSLGPARANLINARAQKTM